MQRLRDKAKKIALLGAASLISLSSALFIFPATTSASYNSANLISDPIFKDANSMGVNAIQSFLISKGSYLRSYHDVEDCYSSSGSHYSFYTSHYHCGKSVLAAQIIYDAAHAYGISPRTIMATMQKEESLITDTSPSSSQINYAMGYGCSDSGGCGSYTGFFHQVDNGTWQFEADYELSSGNDFWGYTPSYYPCNSATKYYTAPLKAGNNVYFKDDYGTAYTHFVIANASTATLYCYTPHAYPGSSREYYSGSYWFVYYFEQWWGSTQLATTCYNGTNVSGKASGRDVTAYQMKSGITSLAFTQMNNTGSACVEVHVWNSGYKSWAAHYSTGMFATDPASGSLIAGNLAFDGKDRVTYLRDSSTLEYHEISSNLKVFPNIYDVSTGLSAADVSGGKIISGDVRNWGYDQLVYIKYSGAGGRVEVHVCSKDKRRCSGIYDALTNLGSVSAATGTFVAGDFLHRGYDQLAYIKYSDIDGLAEIHIFSKDLHNATGTYDVHTNIPTVSATAGTFTVGNFLGKGDQLMYVKYKGSGGNVETHTFSPDLRKGNGYQDIVTNLAGWTAGS